MEPTRITATQLARSLSDVLNRVDYRGERFEIQRNGKTIATLAPTETPEAERGATLREILEAIERGPRMDADLLDELERIQAEQPRYGSTLAETLKAVAMCEPTTVPEKGPTLREILASIERGPRLDPDFLDELEQINANQPLPQDREWPD